jgi:hypothetical protein
MDRAALDLEVDAVVGDEGAVALRDAAQGEVRPAPRVVGAGLDRAFVAYLNQRG